MDVIAPEFHKFTQQHQQYVQESMNELDEIILHLRGMKEILMHEKDNSNELKKSLTNLTSQIKSKANHILESTKETTNAMGKCGKAIDKKFGSADLDWNPRAFEGKDQILHQIIAEHFIREGKFDLAKTFQQEAKVESLQEQDSKFQEMYQILEDMRRFDLNSAIKWASNNCFELNRIDSTLEFDLHKYKYLYLLSKLKSEPDASKPEIISQALDYAKTHFHHYPQRIQEIQKLIGYLIRPQHIHSEICKISDLEHQFARNFCTLLGQSPDAPLFTAIMTGTTALPIIMKMATIMKEKKNEWTSVNELPVEIPLLPKHRFHSIFACPVSREQGSDTNPPMMLPCGHTICNESLKRLSKNGQSRFKCPYCPSDATAASALRIYL